MAVSYGVLSGVKDRIASASDTSNPMSKLVLFDIDGTLVLTGGAGIRAMNRAGESILGLSNLLDGVPVAGRTDWIILHDALKNAGHDLDDDLFVRMRDAHHEFLREEIRRPGEGVKDVMPGVRELLPALQSRDDMSLGLLTGNFEEAARIKLGHFDLWEYFRCGAFGDDAADRNALVPFAVDRARACGLGDFAYGDVIVIGDTPSDVACARAVGAVPVAVATGTYSLDALRQTGAPIVLKDLSDTDGFVRMIS
jgi:phosphoglycolate phosphatase-like HAD superfamily hydrolase